MLFGIRTYWAFFAALSPINEKLLIDKYMVI